MPKLNYTVTDLENILDSRRDSFVEFILDTEHTSGSPEAITSGTPIRFSNNAGSVEWLSKPSYLTTQWDEVNDKIAFPDEYGNPPYVAEIGFTFDPSSANDGFVTLRVYIDDAVPKLIKTYRSPYSGDTESLSLLASWFLGTASGYNAKVDGIYFELEFDSNGSMYDKSLIIYRL